MKRLVAWWRQRHEAPQWWSLATIHRRGEELATITALYLEVFPPSVQVDATLARRMLRLHGPHGARFLLTLAYALDAVLATVARDHPALQPVVFTVDCAHAADASLQFTPLTLRVAWDHHVVLVEYATEATLSTRAIDPIREGVLLGRAMATVTRNPSA